MIQLMPPLMQQQQHLQQTPDDMLVIFGLGNPGPEYEGTRHNAGVETLEKLAASYHAKLVRRCFSSYKTCIITSESGKKGFSSYLHERLWACGAEDCQGR